MKIIYFWIFLLSTVFGSGMQFLAGEAGARYGAMGATGAVMADDAFALYWNPALMPQIEKIAAGMDSHTYPGEDKRFFAGVVFPVKSLTLGFSAGYSVVENIEVRSVPSLDPLSTTQWIDWYVGISAVKQISKPLSAGITYKKLFQSVFDEQATGYAFDLGINYVLSNKINFSWVVSNMGVMDELYEESTSLPLSVESGFFYKEISVTDYGVLNGAVVLEYLSDEPDNHFLVKGGAEFIIKKQFVLRSGYLAGSDLFNFSAGFGWHWSVFKIDYAWKNVRHGFSDVNMFSFSFIF